MLGNRLINCLLYADDVVLLSESAGGLQACIDRLQGYCEEIGLTVNTAKSKVMIFNKGGRHVHHCFKLNGYTLDIAKEYRYLGILFTPSGSFTRAKELLYKKSLKSYFKLKKALSAINNLKLGIRLFDHTISPILTYGSEVLGAFKSTTCNIEQMKFRDIYSHSKLVLTQRKFARFLLGVPMQCPTDALYGELGWHPIYFQIIISVLKYWHRLANEDNNSLLHDALQTHANIKQLEGSNYIDTVKIILQKLNINIPLSLLSNYTSQQFTRLIKDCTTESLESEWQDSVNKSGNNKKHGGNKLRTYATFKSQFQFEPYLAHVTNQQHRRILCQFRTSCHKLNIERGRYHNVRADDRICPYCQQNKVEDEMHFLMECSLYNDERDTYLQKVYSKCPQLRILQKNMLFLWITTAEDQYICLETAKFLHACFSKRKCQNTM